MKKLINFLGLMLLLLSTSMFMSCEKDPVIPDVPGEQIEFKGFKSDSGIIVDDNTIRIVGSTLKENVNEFISYDLKDYVGKRIKIDFSCKMKTSNSTGAFLMWQILDEENDYPIVVMNNVTSSWTDFSGSKNVTVKDGFLFYLSTFKIDYSNLNIDIKNLKLTISEVNQNAEDEWTVAPSLKEAYEGKLDYIGMSVVDNEIANQNIQAGLKRHFNSITMGNEMKPDSIMGGSWSTPTSFEKFTASNGKEIEVPKNRLAFSKLENYLKKCKDNGLKMRGHVLVWHSQTPNWFFTKDYKGKGDYYSDEKINNKDLVDKDTMTARQEWYIKSVLEYIKEWEDNNGERIIYCWDVVNEAADDSGTQLRSGSHWYSIYKSDEFIVNAFRFANKYAPKDVLLAYNDYNECQSNKTEMILKIIKSVQSHENDADLPTRIDVMGMQSHNKYENPTMKNYEDTIKEYLATGLDVHITELDIGAKTKADAEDAQKLKKEYKDYFKMYLKYAKKGDEPGVSSVTIWGITDGSTWLHLDSQQEWLNYVKPQHPLLFDDDYYAKPAFYGVLEAAQESN